MPIASVGWGVGGGGGQTLAQQGQDLDVLYVTVLAIPEINCLFCTVVTKNSLRSIIL